MAVQTGEIRLDTRRLDAIARSLGVRADDIVGAIALELEQDVKLNMHGGGKPHRPSPAGEPPHIEWAGLVNSIKSRRVKDKSWRVEDGVEYGLTHEFGDSTRNIPKRPFMVPAAERVRKNMAEKYKGLFK